MNIPASIKRKIGFQRGTIDHIGCSEAQVLMFEDKVLKIQPDSNSAGNEHQMLRWLQGKLPVPEILEEAFVDGTRYLLMTRLQGMYLCEPEILDDQERLAELVADALHQMWSVEISNCPADRSLDRKFAEIEAGLKGGVITIDQARQSETYGSGGFKTPAALFEWLIKHRPEEQLVFSHGDFCLPNIFCNGSKTTGFIDFGYAGAADRWIDIEKVLWSMWANSTGKFGGKCREFDRKHLFAALDLEPDEDRLRYYSLLSEMC